MAKKTETGRMAEIEIDSNLARAIRERADAIKKVAALQYWNTRLTQLDNEINTLLGYQQRMNGGTPLPTPGFVIPPTVDPIGTYSHAAAIPASVGSIPAKQPIPTNGNISDMVAGEGGFQ
jgi:hypothetical protein